MEKEKLQIKKSSKPHLSQLTFKTILVAVWSLFNNYEYLYTKIINYGSKIN